ncbi:mitochondrial arginine transporter BAC1 isoform X2 [Amborella trichopoda]|uniref:mitochondrial arginine transporter BAC1 isoform X2 n=1 Tax=Amborella trichopoda TaxID=13333 RepID=UPI0009BFD61C|nr:mitochondrial arginine transporter BAC1 isoform X2 [Amborella trichopoda]|eukprot:XP_020531613.1 mitochondrial arginine transporter BAC1 isoform X2 [Amborella trichopoda]
MEEGLKEYAAGFAAGIATVITGHPFDTVKVKLQANNTGLHGKKYRNALHCTAHILRTEGIRGLYKGATSSFIGVSFESSLSFGFYSQAKAALQGEWDSETPRLQTIFPSGAFAGAIISCILCPAELIKCRLQVQGVEPIASQKCQIRYSGPLDCATETIKHEGVKGLFRGGLVTLLREAIGNAVFFSTYEYSRFYMHSQAKSALSSRSQAQDLVLDVGIGIISGGLAGMSVYKRVGIRGCYAGLGPTLTRAFPANAAAIVVWELTAKALGIRPSSN